MKTKAFFIAISALLNFDFCYAQFSSNSFANKVDFSAGINTQGIVLTDLNLDGKKDIVVTNTNTSNIFINLNTTTTGVINSNSCSTTPINLIGLSSLSLIYSGDFDGDNKSDLLVGYTGNSNFSIFRNNYSSGIFSSSSFSPRIDIASGSSTTNIGGIIDVDLDGKLDVVIGSYSVNTITVFRNTSSGVGNISFASGITYATGSSTNPTSLALKDINGDNRPELIVTCFNSSIRVYLNTSSVGNASFSFYTTYTAGTGANFLRLNDIDNDGKLDMICSSYYTGNISIFKNTTTSGIISFISPPVNFNVTSSTNYGSGIDVADLDGDGKPDLCGVGVLSANLSVFRNISSMGIISTSSFATKNDFTTGMSPNEVRIEDFDGDFRPDIINTNYNSGTFSIFKNRILAPEPTIAATNINTIPLSTSVTLNLTKGNGSKRLVVARISSASLITPVDSSFYTPNSIYGNGTNIGSNNFVVYNDTGSTVTVTGLSYGQTYNFTVYEYNGFGGFSNYLTSSSASASQTIGDIFYSKSTGPLNIVSNWGSNQDGTGTSPLSFSSANTVYIVTNNSSPTLTSNWLVSGLNSYVVIGDGINSVNLSIPSGINILTDSLSIRSNAAITFIGGLVANKIFFDSLSLAQFISNNPQSLPGYNYYNLFTLNSTKTLTSNCIVRGTLNLFSNINTASFNLILGTSGNQTGVLNRNSLGTISGKFTRWFSNSTNTGNSGLFPLMVGGNYRPATIEFTSAPNTSGTISSEFIELPSGYNGLRPIPLYDFSVFLEVNKASNSGYWKFDPIGLIGGTHTITLTGAGFMGINNFVDLRILKRTASLNPWTLSGGAVVGTGSNLAPVVGRTGVTGFGEFTLGGDSSTNSLPVKWLSFVGTKHEDGVLLKWSTASEFNNSYFLVERKSSKEQEFESIYKLKATNQSSIKSYSYKDYLSDEKFPIFYRIRQVDHDGSFTFSKEISVYSNNFETDFFVGPNPAKDFIYIQNYDLNTPINFTNTLGQNFPLKIDNDKIYLNEIVTGIYFLNITSKDGERKSIKIIKE